MGKQIDAYAANLWGLLAPETAETNDSRNTPFDYDFRCTPTRHVFASSYGVFDHRLESIGMPVELDGIEIPFVHGHCLIGFENEGYENSIRTPTESAPVATEITHPMPEP